MPKFQIKRKYAEWMEDAFTVTAPDGVSDDDLRVAFDDLYAASFESKEHKRPVPVTVDTDDGEVDVDVEFLWDDENRSGIDSFDDEIEVGPA